MKTLLSFALILAASWLPSAAFAESRRHVIVDCEWVAGYLHSIAVLRDQGAKESAMIVRAEALAKEKEWPDRLKAHVTQRIHLVFADLVSEPPYVLSSDYLHGCAAAGGNIR